MVSCIILYLSLLLLVDKIVANDSLNSYSSKCDIVLCKIVNNIYKDIEQFKIMNNDNICIPQYGSKTDELCNSALEEFSLQAPIPDDSKENEFIYDKKIDDLEKLIDAPLHVIYLKQLSLLRDKALKTFKQTLATAEGTEFDAMMQADELFRREAEDATRQNPNWSYAREVAGLKSSLLEIANRSKKLTDVKLQASKQSQQAMQYLQMQQQQLQAIQQQLSGQSSPWNIGLAYRLPDTNINLSGSYQQGKGNVQISCVPDEAMSLLGPNGFVHGVTPGNIGVSFNINI